MLPEADPACYHVPGASWHLAVGAGLLQLGHTLQSDIRKVVH